MENNNANVSDAAQERYTNCRDRTNCPAHNVEELKSPSAQRLTELNNIFKRKETDHPSAQKILEVNRMESPLAVPAAEEANQDHGAKEGEDIVRNLIDISKNPPPNACELIKVKFTVESKNFKQKVIVNVHPVIEEIIKDFLDTLQQMQLNVDKYENKDTLAGCMKQFGCMKKIFS